MPYEYTTADECDFIHELMEKGNRRALENYRQLVASGQKFWSPDNRGQQAVDRDEVLSRINWALRFLDRPQTHRDVIV